MPKDDTGAPLFGTRRLHLLTIRGHEGCADSKVSLAETWHAMEDLLKTGLVKAIGVSNWRSIDLLDLLSWGNAVASRYAFHFSTW